MNNAGIIGMGHAYPSGVLTNADLERIVDTSDEWIQTRTGIKQRHKAAEGEYTSQFGTKAAQQALDRAGLKPEDIEIIVCATTTPDQIMRRTPPEWTFLPPVPVFYTALRWSNQ
jgi:3-oxoacyl-[acyl-carrier-protein] synthase-3